jgi:5'-AMP-activated protein kinase regulatory gamma subunit
MNIMDQSDETYDKFALHISKVPLANIPWRTAKNRLVTLTLDTSVRAALDKLATNNILSAPVFDEFGAFQGFSDFQQLTRFCVRMCRGQPKPGIFTTDYYNKSAQLRNTTIRDLISGNTGHGCMYGEYAYPITEDSSLFQALERMAREGQHRLAVQDTFGRVCGVLVQSQLIKYMHDHISQLGQAKYTTVEEMRPYSFISTINENAPAIQAFELMDSKRISMNGIAVTNDSGHLTDVISTHDLRSILPGSYEYNKMWGSVKEFKTSVRSKYPNVRTLPVKAKRSDTLQSVISKMAINKVHRVFIVNEFNTPIDVLSQTDILRHILDSRADSWW